jgi:hypothetical protein
MVIHESIAPGLFKILLWKQQTFLPEKIVIINAATKTAMLSTD